jgi:integrase
LRTVVVATYRHALRDPCLHLGFKRADRLLEAFMRGMNDISDDLVFQSPDGGILDPDNLYHRYFLPVLAKTVIRKIRLHDLRHTFGSLLIQAGASINQRLHSSKTSRSRSGFCVVPYKTKGRKSINS